MLFFKVAAFNKAQHICIPSVPRKWFGSADCDTKYILSTVHTDPNPFRGKYCIKMGATTRKTLGALGARTNKKLAFLGKPQKSSSLNGRAIKA